MVGAFAGSATGIGITVAAVDATATTFRGVAGRVSAFKAQLAGVGASLRTAALAALPFVGVVGAIRAAASAFREMSALTDRAADAGTSAPVLQKLVGAMQQLGVRGASLDTVSRAMQNMARTTGEVGAEGFAKVLGQAARMGSEAERLDFLTQAFGRTQGAVFASIIREGDAGVQKLIELAGGYPAVGDAAAQAGDRASDAMARAGDAINAGWSEMLGNLVIGFEGVFGPLPEVAANIANAILIAFKFVSDTVVSVVVTIRSAFEALLRPAILLFESVFALGRAVFDSSYSFSQAFDDIGDAASTHVRDFVDGISEATEGLFDFSGIGATTETKGVFDRMTAATKAGGVTLRTETAKAATAAATAAATSISNAFSRGGTFALRGSNEARKLIAGNTIGGAAQSQRAVSQFLPRIAAAADRIAAGMGGLADDFDELETI